MALSRAPHRTCRSHTTEDWRRGESTPLAHAVEEAAAEPHTVVHSPFVFVRRAPSTDAKILGRLLHGTVLLVQADNGQGWMKLVGREGWVLRDGRALGLGLLLAHAPGATPAPPEALLAAPDGSIARSRAFQLLLAAPPVSADGPLPAGTSGPVERCCVARPFVGVRAAPHAASGLVGGAMLDDYVWSCCPEQASPSGWVRLAEPDGWVSVLCPAGLPQLRRAPPAAVAVARTAQRELEALDLYSQARLAVLQALGPAGRPRVRELFDRWEAEAEAVAARLAAVPGAWEASKRERALEQRSAFAQALLASVHRDVVLWAQEREMSRVLPPRACALADADLGGAARLQRAHVATLRESQLVVVDEAIGEEWALRCLREAEALDAAGRLQPPAMHRALGDRRDRLCALSEAEGDGGGGGGGADALARLAARLKSLASELETHGHAEPLLVPPSPMLACYDGAGAFYKPHLDSMGSDPRRVTAILYLVPPGWDASPEADGGRLEWWAVDEADPDAAPAAGARRAVAPRCGTLVLFNSRTVKHEVLPTHRKRFAVTLWFYAADSARR